MSTYCISDIHGHKDELDEMLDKIAFGSNDRLYILGDIIDKGPDSAALLMWATTEAPDNVFFLRGNHEDMAYPVLSRNPRELRCIRRNDLWTINGGIDTVNDLGENTDPDWRETILLPWLEKLTPYTTVKVADKDFALVHAGFDPYYYDFNTEEDPNHAYKLLTEIGYPDPGFLMESYDVGHCVGIQDAQTMMWIRESWLYDKVPAPVETVFGHSVLKSEASEMLRESGVDKNARGGSGKIFHVLNKHCIDCGCAAAMSSDEYNLGCLRLDDKEEFYVPAKKYDAPYDPW